MTAIEADRCRWAYHSGHMVVGTTELAATGRHCQNLFPTYFPGVKELTVTRLSSTCRP